MNYIRMMLVTLAALGLSVLSSAAELSLKQLLTEERVWAGLTTKTITTGEGSAEVKWTYSEGGNASQPTVLLLHGLTGSRDNWNRVAHYLTPYYHVVVPDLPLHGETEVRDEYDPQTAQVVDSIEDFVEALGLKDVNLAGHSLGGAAATFYATKNFYNVQSVLLVDSAGVYATAQSKYLKNPELIRDMLVQKPGDLDRLLDIAMHNRPFLPKAILKEYEQEQIRLAPKTKRMVDKTIELAKLYTPDSFKIISGGIEAPTLVIWGQEDAIIDVGVTKELAENLKNEEAVVILPGVGHTPIMEAEQLVVMKYLPFLAKAQKWQNPFKGAAP